MASQSIYYPSKSVNTEDAIDFEVPRLGVNMVYFLAILNLFFTGKSSSSISDIEFCTDVRLLSKSRELPASV